MQFGTFALEPLAETTADGDPASRQALLPFSLPAASRFSKLGRQSVRDFDSEPGRGNLDRSFQFARQRRSLELDEKEYEIAEYSGVCGVESTEVVRAMPPVDHQWGVMMLFHNEKRERSRDASISIGERMYLHEPMMKPCRLDDRMDRSRFYFMP